MEIKIVEITDENCQKLLHLAISGYIGEKCRYCQHVYKSVDDIDARNVVYAGKNQYACKACFDAANPAKIDENPRQDYKRHKNGVRQPRRHMS